MLIRPKKGLTVSKNARGLVVMDIMKLYRSYLRGTNLFREREQLDKSNKIIYYSVASSLKVKITSSL